MNPADLEYPAGVEALIERELDRLAGPGTWWTGTERVAIAAEARAALGAPLPAATPLRDMAVEAARKIAAEPETITEAWVRDILGRGLKPEAMVELLGVVSRLMTIDTLSFAVDRPLRSLPQPKYGDPSNRYEAGATLQDTWLPLVKPASLSAVAAEEVGRQDVMTTLNGPTSFDSLTPAQAELVICRTSLLNHCFP